MTDKTTLETQRDLLRAALLGLVGVDGRKELDQMELAIREMPAAMQDRAVTLDAIHALIATLPAPSMDKPAAKNAVDPVASGSHETSTREA